MSLCTEGQGHHLEPRGRDLRRVSPRNTTPGQTLCMKNLTGFDISKQTLCDFSFQGVKLSYTKSVYVNDLHLTLGPWMTHFILNLQWQTTVDKKTTILFSIDVQNHQRKESSFKNKFVLHFVISWNRKFEMWRIIFSFEISIMKSTVIGRRFSFLNKGFHLYYFNKIFLKYFYEIDNRYSFKCSNMFLILKSWNFPNYFQLKLFMRVAIFLLRSGRFVNRWSSHKKSHFSK